MYVEYIKFYKIKTLNVSREYAKSFRTLLDSLPPLEQLTTEWILTRLNSKKSEHSKFYRLAQIKMVLRFYDRSDCEWVSDSMSSNDHIVQKLVLDR